MTPSSSKPRFITRNLAGFYRADRILRQGDEVLIITAIFLTMFGSVMVYSATYFVANFSVFLKHLALVGIGIIAMIIGMIFDPLIYKKTVKLGIIIISLMMFLQLITPLGPEINGTKRWFAMGAFRLQTAEIARMIMILFFARVLSENPRILKKWDKDFTLFLAVPGVISLLIFLQPDFSSMGMMVVVLSIMLFLGGMNILYFMSAGAVGIPLVYFLLKDYQKARLFGEWSYQQIQSFIALVKGGLFGDGLALGTQKKLYLPEAHNDFIFAIIGEEWGWFGTAGVLCAAVLLFIRGIRICMVQTNPYYKLLSAGLICSLTLYALVNIAVNVGLLPVTGLPLPFISKGGTSLIVSLWSIGVLWRLSYKR